MEPVMASTTRKTTAARKTASKTASKSTSKTAAKKTAPVLKVKKSDVPEWDRDYTYLAEKPATDLHEDFAAWMEDVIGLEFDDDQREAFLKGVQVAAILRGVYQRSPRNKARTTYRPLDEAVVAKRSEHMILAHTEAGELISKRPARKAVAKATKASAAKAPAKATAAKRTTTRKATAKKA
jgi:hypothetical protein